jgi:hypothetical protein
VPRPARRNRSGKTLTNAGCGKFLAVLDLDVKGGRTPTLDPGCFGFPNLIWPIRR